MIGMVDVQVADTGHLAGSRFWVPGFGCRIQRISVSCFVLRAYDSKFRVLDLGFRFSGFGVRSSAAGFRLEGLGTLRN